MAKSKYKEIESRFNEIAQWLRRGASDGEIIKNLGIGKSSFYKYLQQHTEFSDLIKKNRINPVEEIKAALFKRATGFKYEEKKIIREEGVLVREETYIKTALPDPASAMILLKHWAKDEGWTQDPQSLALRRREIELKEKQFEQDNW